MLKHSPEQWSLASQTLLPGWNAATIPSSYRYESQLIYTSSERDMTRIVEMLMIHMTLTNSNLYIYVYLTYKQTKKNICADDEMQIKLMLVKDITHWQAAAR